MGEHQGKHLQSTAPRHWLDFALSARRSGRNLLFRSAKDTAASQLSLKLWLAVNVVGGANVKIILASAGLHLATRAIYCGASSHSTEVSRGISYDKV